MTTHRPHRRALRPGDVTVTPGDDGALVLTICGSSYLVSEANARTLAVDLADIILTGKD